MFKAAVAGPRKVITANRLRDGLVIFIGPDRTWVTDIRDALTFADGPELEAGTAFGQEGVVGRFLIDPYPIDVTVENGVPEPLRLREAIRAKGPTVVYGDEERKKLGGVAA
ncbi:MAG: DUF2849 domain-containing protein [Bauldia sp.]